MKVYNGEGMILGRLAQEVAKQSLLGEEIKVINCEKVIISGNKRKVLENEKERRDRKGYPTKSAKFTRLPDRMVRRSIRGMLPWKQTRGKEAFKRIMCYIGQTEEMAAQAITLEHASVNKLPNTKYITIGEISKWLGGKL